MEILFKEDSGADAVRYHKMLVVFFFSVIDSTNSATFSGIGLRSFETPMGTGGTTTREDT